MRRNGEPTKEITLFPPIKTAGEGRTRVSPMPASGIMKSKIKTNLFTFGSLFALSLSGVAADDQKADADNTGKNERDRAAEAKTPEDQGNSPEDRKLTQAIRQAVMKEDGLSMTAKNVKIITAGGAVTLRGPVNTLEEKKKIEDLAKTTAGGAKVDSQIEVKAADHK